MSNLQKEIEDQIIKRQKEWDAGEYPHPESVFKGSMESDRNLLSIVLRSNNETVAKKRQVAVSAETCTMDSMVKTKRKPKAK